MRFLIADAVARDKMPPVPHRHFAGLSSFDRVRAFISAVKERAVHLEGLERRRLLAAATISVVSGKLTVTGTANADSVAITKSGGSLVVTIDGSPHTISQTVNQILLIGNGGDDVLTISDAVTKPATVQGGAGNDLL